jgi:hypothetical protein
MSNVLDVKVGIEASAAVQCHYPCVSECQREHDWDKKESAE